MKKTTRKTSRILTCINGPSHGQKVECYDDRTGTDVMVSSVASAFYGMNADQYRVCLANGKKCLTILEPCVMGLKLDPDVRSDSQPIHKIVAGHAFSVSLVDPSLKDQFCASFYVRTNEPASALVLRLRQMANAIAKHSRRSMKSGPSNPS